MSCLCLSITLGSLDFPNSSNKAVAPLRHGFDVTYAVFAIPKRFTQQIDSLAQVVFFHNRVAPYRPHEDVFFQQPSIVLHQHQQGVENARREFHTRSAMEQQTLSRIENEWAKFVQVPDNVMHLISVRKPSQKNETG